MIKLKSKHDIACLTKGGQILRAILDELETNVKIGAIPSDLDKKARQLITAAGCQPSFLNYAPDRHRPFPAALCVSVNDVVVHGIPDNTPFAHGDIVGLDLGLILANKYYLDSARTVTVGRVNRQLKKMVAITKESLRQGIVASRVNNRIGDISAAIQACVEQAGFTVIRQLVGHGVGYAVHEPPQVPNFGLPHQGEKIKPGLVIALEPMVTIGDPTVVVSADGWSIKVATGQRTAHFEHTIAVTTDGSKVLTG